eukprot:354617-Chlamydomonas_euryale.AAC.4
MEGRAVGFGWWPRPACSPFLRTAIAGIPNWVRSLSHTRFGSKWHSRCSVKHVTSSGTAHKVSAPARLDIGVEERASRRAAGALVGDVHFQALRASRGELAEGNEVKAGELAASMLGLTSADAL